MPEKKPTDNEIVKALECCLETSGVNCGECPYCENCVTDENTSLMMADALDLINRQKAEIERLKTSLNVELDGFASEYDDKIKAEAYKEFAERLKNEINVRTTFSKEQDKNVLIYINNLLKEMVGDEK